MGITAISRDWGDNVAIVRISCSDSYSTLIGTGYITDQYDNIVAANNGEFQWLDSDAVLVNFAANSCAFFTISSDKSSLIPVPNLSGILSSATVTITASQFNGMYAAPKQIIAAPGAGNLIVVSQAVLDLTYGTAQFAAGGAVALQYDSTVHGAGVLATGTQAAAGFTGATANTIFSFNAGALVALSSATINKGLYLSNQTAAFTTGDSTFAMTVYYRIISAT